MRLSPNNCQHPPCRRRRWRQRTCVCVCVCVQARLLRANYRTNAGSARARAANMCAITYIAQPCGCGRTRAFLMRSACVRSERTARACAGEVAKKTCVSPQNQAGVNSLPDARAAGGDCANARATSHTLKNRKPHYCTRNEARARKGGRLEVAARERTTGLGTLNSQAQRESTFSHVHRTHTRKYIFVLTSRV